MRIGNRAKAITTTALTAFAMTAFCGVAQAAPILDQNNPPSGSLQLNDSLEWQQQVTAGLSGTLSGIELYSEKGSDTVTVKIGVGSVFDPGPFAFTGSALITTGGVFVDASAANIALAAGQHFVIDVSGGTADITGACCTLGGSTSAYAGGDLDYFIGGSPFDETTLYGYSLAFETFITPNNAVPEPCTLALFGSGLAGAVAMRRRKKKAA